MIPSVWHNTVGSIIPNARKYTDVIRALGRYAKLVSWTVAVWISFTPLIINHYTGDFDANARSDLTIFVSILFGLFLCTIVLGVEKFIIQLIAYVTLVCMGEDADICIGSNSTATLMRVRIFDPKQQDVTDHSSLDRLKDQKFQVKCLTALYINSHDVSGTHPIPAMLS